MQSLKSDVVKTQAEEFRHEDKKPDEEPKEFGEKFQILVNLLPDPVALVNSKGRILVINDRVLEKTGFKREELVGKNFLRTNVVTRKSKAILLKNLALRMMGKHVAPYEVEVLTKTNKRLPYEVNATSIVYEGKTADLVVFRDIEPRRKAEEALRNSEEKYRRVVEHSIQGILIVQDFQIVYANKALEKISGYSLSELQSLRPERVKNMVHPEDQALVWGRFQKRLAGEHVPPQYEYRGVQKDGTIVWLEMFAHRIEYNGKPAIQGAIMDITERKIAEETLRRYAENLQKEVEKRTKGLRESEEKLKSIFDASPDAIIVTDLSGKITECSHAAFGTNGYTSKDELIGRSAFEFIAAKDKQRAMENLRKTLEQGSTKNIEYTCLTHDGREFPAELSARLIRDASGAPLAFVGILKDITERKRMEKQLLSAERLAATGELANIVGHDLRNPLQSIENAAYYLTNEVTNLPASVQISPKMIEMVQVINASVSYADKIIRDLQDFSAPKPLTLEKTDLNSIVQEALLQVQLPENVKLHTELDALMQIQIDRDIMKRVFLNLIVNAVQAMENGGDLTISTKEKNGFIQVSFRDTGIGISKENMKKIFTPFYTTKAKGMGMGLPICRKFLEGHRGTLDVESKEGEGSTFTVKLPSPQENRGEKS